MHWYNIDGLSLGASSESILEEVYWLVSTLRSASSHSRSGKNLGISQSCQHNINNNMQNHSIVIVLTPRIQFQQRWLFNSWLPHFLRAAVGCLNFLLSWSVDQFLKALIR